MTASAASNAAACAGQRSVDRAHGSIRVGRCFRASRLNCRTWVGLETQRRSHSECAVAGAKESSVRKHIMPIGEVVKTRNSLAPTGSGGRGSFLNRSCARVSRLAALCVRDNADLSAEAGSKGAATFLFANGTPQILQGPKTESRPAAIARAETHKQSRLWSRRTASQVHPPPKHCECASTGPSEKKHCASGGENHVAAFCVKIVVSEPVEGRMAGTGQERAGVRS